MNITDTLLIIIRVQVDPINETAYHEINMQIAEDSTDMHTLNIVLKEIQNDSVCDTVTSSNHNSLLLAYWVGIKCLTQNTIALLGTKLATI